jgi:integrase
MPKLSDTRIRAAKARLRPYKVFDTDGLFIVVTPAGGRWWRQRYRHAGKEQLLSLGTYPEVSLSAAREKRDAIRKQLAAGIDPSVQRRTEKLALLDAKSNTFKAIVLDWHRQFKPQWSTDHADRILQRLEENTFPWLGAKPIADVTSKDIIACLKRLADRGIVDTTHRLLQNIKQIFSWAITHERALASPAAHIKAKDIAPALRIKHRAAIKDPVQFGVLLRAIDAYQGGFVVKCGLRFLALTFVRPGELRHARWEEFNLEGKEPEWRIPAERMKMAGDQPHIVPLSRQAVAVLQELAPVTGADGKGLVFPSNRNAARPLSENTLNAALRTMGFTQQQHCSHGFRGSASTMLNEQSWHKDAIERQMAHMPRDKVRASYNSAEHLPLRRKMMQAWADHLDALRANKNIAPTKRNA